MYLCAQVCMCDCVSPADTICSVLCELVCTPLFFLFHFTITYFDKKHNKVSKNYTWWSFSVLLNVHYNLIWQQLLLHLYETFIQDYLYSRVESMLFFPFPFSHVSFLIGHFIFPPCLLSSICLLLINFLLSVTLKSACATVFNCCGGLCGGRGGAVPFSINRWQ